MTQWDACVGQCSDPLPVSCQWEQSSRTCSGQQTRCSGRKRHSAYSKQRLVVGQQPLYYCYSNSPEHCNLAQITASPLLLQVSEGNVCWTHHLRYYSVTCVWILGRAKLVCLGSTLLILWYLRFQTCLFFCLFLFLLFLFHRFLQWDCAHRWSSEFPWSGS